MEYNHQLYRLIQQGGTSTQLQNVINLGADPNYIHEDTCMLEYACLYRRYNFAYTLIENGANVVILQYTSHLRHIMHQACIYNNLTMVSLLLELGCDITQRYNNTTLLHIVCSIGNLEVLKLFLQQQIQLDCVDINLREPIHIAVKSGKTDIVEYLLDNGAHTHSLDFEGNTPLHFACQYKLESCIRVLMTRNSNIFIKNIYEETSVDIAYKCEDITQRNTMLKLLGVQIL